MLDVETIGRIRRAYFVEKRAIREIVRDLGVSRKTVRKAVREGGTEFRYERKIQPQPQLGLFVERLDALLTENAKRSSRERLTARRRARPLDRLPDGHGQVPGGEDARSVRVRHLAGE